MKRNKFPMFVFVGGFAAFPTPRNLGTGNSWFMLIGERAERANPKSIYMIYMFYTARKHKSA